MLMHSAETMAPLGQRSGRAEIVLGQRRSSIRGWFSAANPNRTFPNRLSML